MSADGTPSRQKLINDWIKLGSLITSAETSKLRGRPDYFIAGDWCFKPENAIAHMLAPEECFWSERSILVAGFSAWVIKPHVSKFVQQAMMHRGRLKLRIAERRGRKLFQASKAFGEMAGRLFVPDLAFYELFYFPVSREVSWTQLSSREEHRQEARKQAGMVSTVCNLLGVYHWHAVHLRDDQMHEQASLNRGSLILKKIAGLHQSREAQSGKTVERHWHKLGLTAALLYAANTIPVEGDRNLLDYILENRLSGHIFNHHQDVWLGRARFVALHVMSHVADDKYSARTMAYLPDGPTYALPLPPYSAEEISVIESLSRPKRYRSLSIEAFSCVNLPRRG